MLTCKGRDNWSALYFQKHSQRKVKLITTLGVAEPTICALHNIANPEFFSISVDTTWTSRKYYQGFDVSTITRSRKLQWAKRRL
jgi:hypothetical protein